MQPKTCKFCGKEFYKENFPKTFHKMMSCGSMECKRKIKQEWTYSKTCPDCGIPITRSAKKCHRCISLGENNPFYGRTHTEETKGKLKLFEKGGVSFMKGRRHTMASKMKNSLSHQGGHPYTDGLLYAITRSIRHSIEYKQWRRGVFIRDNFTCRECGQHGGGLEAHHKKSFSKLMSEARECSPLLPVQDACMAYDPMWHMVNGITLCEKCHDKKRKENIVRGEYK